jgi:hypothetical protein
MNHIHEVLDGVNAQTDDLWDGQLWTTNVLNELHQCSPPDNMELVERLQQLEDLINRLAEAQRHSRAPTPVESLFDSRSDILSTIRRLRERLEWDGLRQEPQGLIYPTPVRPQTLLDNMMAKLLHPPQPPASPQIQPPPAFLPLIFQPDAHGLQPAWNLHILLISTYCHTLRLRLLQYLPYCILRTFHAAPPSHSCCQGPSPHSHIVVSNQCASHSLTRPLLSHVLGCKMVRSCKMLFSKRSEHPLI